MSGVGIRLAAPADRAAIRRVEERAFGQPAEADLVAALVASSDAVLELVAEKDAVVVGHILFSRLWVEAAGRRFAAVALAPVAVDPDHQRAGIGAALIEAAHERLRESGEALSVVLGDPAYYARFGYRRDAAEKFASAFQCDALQALAWNADASTTGMLVYAPAFGAF